jgi:hypothetical protein
MKASVNVVAVVKDGERFIFLYDKESMPELLKTLGRFASDPELNFSWYDAAVLSQRARTLETEEKPCLRKSR